MKHIAVIPARAGSKRLPGKNLLPFAGLPLVAHSIEYALRHRDLIDAIYVTTDSEEVKKVAASYGVIPVHRPASLSGDLEPTVSAIRHVLEKHDIADDVAVVLLQPTNPLRPSDLLRTAFEIWASKSCDSLFTVSLDSKKYGYIESGTFIPFNYKPGQRSQDLKPLYYENGLLYISKAANIYSNEIMTGTAFPMIVDHPFASVDIDDAGDLLFAQFINNTYNTQ